MTMAKTTKIVNTWTNFIFVPLVGGFDDLFVLERLLKLFMTVESSSGAGVNPRET